MKRFIRSIPGKTLLFFLFTITISVFIATGICIGVMTQDDVWKRPKEEVLMDYKEGQLTPELYNYVQCVLCDNQTYYSYLPIKLLDENGNVVKTTEVYDKIDDFSDYTEFGYNCAKMERIYDNGMDSSYESWIDFYYDEDDYTIPVDEENVTWHATPFKAIVYANMDTPMSAEEVIITKGYDFIYSYKNMIIPLCIVSFVLSIIIFIAVMCAAGHTAGSDELVPGVFFKVPFDLICWILLGCLVLYVTICDEFRGEILIAMVLVGIVAWADIVLGLCMSLASRLKQHQLWNHLILFYVLKFCWWLLKLCGKALRGVGRGNAGLLRSIGRGIKSIPMYWRTILIICVVSLFEFIGIVGLRYETGALLFVWFIEKIVIVVVVLGLARALRRLKAAGENLAAGNIDDKVDTKGLYWEFKDHAENLNSISEGMTSAVAQKMKSERMKTELITNVSHDIKTPLTSIINYASLIGEEECENEKIKEYSAVLVRQSDKLKRLIEDLVEASKAQTGNLDVCPVPCEASLFVSQAGGEYEEKLEAAGLTLVTTVPEEDVYIMADNRRMWRVFDNLMNNISKYSQNGTRVYISLVRDGNEAVFTFKNTSREALNISADELMERFVRGDSSRNTEGNGLGLSIARSLVELQGGSFALDVDGDLFKSILRFPVISV